MYSLRLVFLFKVNFFWILFSYTVLSSLALRAITVLALIVASESGGSFWSFLCCNESAMTLYHKCVDRMGFEPSGDDVAEIEWNISSWPFDKIYTNSPHLDKDNICTTAFCVLLEELVIISCMEIFYFFNL